VRGEIACLTPVFGLRPTRSFFLWGINDANLEILTVSPFDNAVIISCNICSINLNDSAWEKPSSR
jgi:hypothetical protein